MYQRSIIKNILFFFRDTCKCVHIYSTVLYIQSDRCVGDVVSDSFNMAFRDEDSILYQICSDFLIMMTTQSNEYNIRVAQFNEFIVIKNSYTLDIL